MMKLITATVMLIIIVQNVYGIVFTRCELAKQLLINNFPRSELDNWVCLVESESSRNTKAVGGPNNDGSYDWGLFQINDRYWCKVGKKGGECNLECNELLSDNIQKASKCTQLIFKIHGWSGWYGWLNKCQNKPLPNIQQECGF